MTPLFLLAAASAYRLGTGVTPVQKVISMMEEMMAKGKAEKESEAVQHGEYMQWCEKTRQEKTIAVRDAELVIEKQSAAAQKAAVDAETLGDEVKALDAQIAEWQESKEEATKVRQTEKADFDALDAEQTESLDAMDRGISTLTARASGGIADTTVLTQLTKLSPEASRSSREELLSAGAKIDVFLQEESARRASAPQGTTTTYEFHADGIIDTIKEMKEKMEDERTAARREETDKKYAYDLLMEQFTTDIEHATEERDAKTTLKAERTEDGAAARADVVETTATRDADKKYLADLVTQCEQKSVDFDSRQQMRKEELEALSKAIEIMSDGAVSGNAEKHLPTLLQTKHSLALRRSAGKSLSLRRVGAFLSDHAQKAESRLLAQVADKVLQGGPFDKVKEMIEGLIGKLVQEAAEEADHKAWCDKEQHTNKNTRDTKSSEVNRLTAQQEKLTAEIQLLTNEIAELEKELSEANASLKEATAQRAKEKAKNEEAIADAKEAIVAVRQALSVLQSFYAKAAQATALVQSTHKAKQSPADDAPASFTTPYKGLGGSSKGVLGMLEVILADFSRLQAETSSSEAESADAFEKFAEDTSTVIASKRETAADKGKLKARKEKTLVEVEKDIRATQEELDSANDYNDKLKSSCVDAGVSYADRQARRQAEIESLKEALRILGSDDA
jgi:predicted RNase H-like nuclease (RuvC/YqgF family)